MDNDERIKSKQLEVDGVQHTAHEAKSIILYDFYKGLLGVTPTTSWAFNLRELYPHFDVDTTELSAPFHPDEINNALFAMDMNVSP